MGGVKGTSSAEGGGGVAGIVTVQKKKRGGSKEKNQDTAKDQRQCKGRQQQLDTDIDVANHGITVQPVTKQTSNKGREGY